MITSYPSYRSDTVFHSNVHKDVVRRVGAGEREGPNGDSNSEALPLPNEGLEPTPDSRRVAPAFGRSSGLALDDTGKNEEGKGAFLLERRLKP